MKLVAATVGFQVSALLLFGDCLGQMTANKLVMYCETKGSVSDAICRGYISGVVDAALQAYQEQEKEVFLVPPSREEIREGKPAVAAVTCLPPRQTAADLRDQVLSYVKEHPEELMLCEVAPSLGCEQGSTLVLNAIRAAHCKD